MDKVVLIVDDDPRSMKLTFDLLGVFGYTSIRAFDGVRAVQLAKSQKPDLILMDIQLPLMDGIEAAKLIKSDVSTRQIPIIATTAYAMKGDEEKIKGAGCDGYITKPINIHELLKTVEQYLSSGEADHITGNRSSENEER
jgi:two-component system cell cycle response regulator DivK